MSKPTTEEEYWEWYSATKNKEESYHEEDCEWRCDECDDPTCLYSNFNWSDSDTLNSL